MVEYLGWVDFDLGSSPGWWAATVATYCPSRMVEHPKSKSTQPSNQPPSPPCTSLFPPKRMQLLCCNQPHTHTLVKTTKFGRRLGTGQRGAQLPCQVRRWQPHRGQLDHQVQGASDGLLVRRAPSHFWRRRRPSLDRFIAFPRSVASPLF